MSDENKPEVKTEEEGIEIVSYDQFGERQVTRVVDAPITPVNETDKDKP